MAQIPFTRGVPSADLLPVDDLRTAVDTALTREPALALAYLGGAGHPGLRAWIGERHGVPAERVVASNGSLQAFLFLSELLVERSSTKRVLVEAPTYDRPLILLRRAGAEPEHPLMELLTRYRTEPRRDIGRNEPCWCGSGKKFKKCHGA